MLLPAQMMSKRNSSGDFEVILAMKRWKEIFTCSAVTGLLYHFLNRSMLLIAVTTLFHGSILLCMLSLASGSSKLPPQKTQKPVPQCDAGTPQSIRAYAGLKSPRRNIFRLHRSAVSFVDEPLPCGVI